MAHQPAVPEYRWQEFLKYVADRAIGFSFHWHNHDAESGRCHLFHANIALKSLFSDGKPCTIHAHHSPCRVEFTHDAIRLKSSRSRTSSKRRDSAAQESSCSTRSVFQRRRQHWCSCPGFSPVAARCSDIRVRQQLHRQDHRGGARARCSCPSRAPARQRPRRSSNVRGYRS